MSHRIGHGYDLHRLEPILSLSQSKLKPQSSQTRPLVLAGVPIPPVQGGVELGVVAHSDGDVLFHAITDALLGALAQPDIGQLFPDHDPSYAAADSRVFIREAAARVRSGGWRIENLDATIVLERPRLSPHKPAIRESIARELGIEVARVNVKGKSHEGVDAVGEGRAVEAHVVVLLADGQGAGGA